MTRRESRRDRQCRLGDRRNAVAVIDTGGTASRGDCSCVAAIRARHRQADRMLFNTLACRTLSATRPSMKTEPYSSPTRTLPRALATQGTGSISIIFAAIMGDELIDEGRIGRPTVLVEVALRSISAGRPIKSDIARIGPRPTSDNDLPFSLGQSKTCSAGDLVSSITSRCWMAAFADGSPRLGELNTLPAQRVVPGHGPIAEWPAALSDEPRYIDTLAVGRSCVSPAARDQDATEDRGGLGAAATEKR